MVQRKYIFEANITCLSSIPYINMLGDITLMIGSCQDTMHNNELTDIGQAFLKSEKLF